MTVPLFLVEATQMPLTGTHLVAGNEGRHAVKVRRLRVGERVDLADGAGTLAECTVISAGPDGLGVAVQQVHTIPARDPQLVVVQALPKGDRGELAVELMTELGVDEIVPWAAQRCVTVWSDPRGDRARERWVTHAREAAKQAHRARVPGVALLADAATVVGRIRAAQTTLVLHSCADAPLDSVSLPGQGTLLVIVGPEGGLSELELTAFAEAGAQVARLGPEVLRTSSAGAAALAVLSARLGRWS